MPMVGLMKPTEQGLLDGQKPARKFNNKKSIILSIWAAIFFGIANFLLADISKKNGIEAVYP
jgi:hypothetical protein